MRSGEKSQGKVKWQGLAFRGKGNWKGGELIWKSETKAKVFSGRVKLLGIKRETSEETPKMPGHRKTHQGREMMRSRQNHEKCLWQKYLASIKLSEVHFKMINFFLWDKIQLSFILFFMSSDCSRFLNHSDCKKSRSQTHCSEECHNIPSV